jgi:hypothetical protein
MPDDNALQLFLVNGSFGGDRMAAEGTERKLKAMTTTGRYGRTGVID